MKARTNEEWLRELSAASESQSDAIADLRAYLLRAALYSLTQAQSALAQLGPAAIGQMAEDCAQDALLAILQHLHEFRGDEPQAPPLEAGDDFTNQTALNPVGFHHHKRSFHNGLQFTE